jgi:hypothetical protein
LGAAALASLDQLLAERPDRVGADFSAATRHLAAYRDALAAEWRRTASQTDRARLASVNAVISVVVGGHYPLGDIPWPHIEKARSLLVRAAQLDGAQPVPGATAPPKEALQ